MAVGLWLYDLLAMFRAPGFHQGMSKKKMLQEIPFLKGEGLSGGFRYFDASMQDDVLVLETLRAASTAGAAVANYVEALSPMWDGSRISGFRVKDHEDLSGKSEFEIKAHRSVICVGPWLDQLGIRMSAQWGKWITPSKGVHLVFDLKRIPIKGALVMTHPEDGRIAFVIPREDLGEGVAIVGTTDGPTGLDPDQAEVTSKEVDYLMGLLNRYFPDLKLTVEDIVSAYVGVRPLMNASREGSQKNKKGAAESSSVLQKVSREHHIDEGPGGTVLVAGGKYTTHRKMAGEIVDRVLEIWQRDSEKDPAILFPKNLGAPQVDSPLNPEISVKELAQVSEQSQRDGLTIPKSILMRFGKIALEWAQARQNSKDQLSDSLFLKERLDYSIQYEMALHLEDFYFRRCSLFMTRKDHGLSFAKDLAEVLLKDTGQDLARVDSEVQRLNAEVQHRDSWRKSAALRK
ncbi:MAG: FAD-dependent oxidoreductase [Bdellovibrio sp.]|nr:FAD-dependent oxidoreductase [Bdellovibrio sp.]